MQDDFSSIMPSLPRSTFAFLYQSALHGKGCMRSFPFFRKRLQPLTQQKPMTMIDYQGTCQKTGASLRGDGRCPDGASVPGGCLQGEILLLTHFLLLYRTADTIYQTKRRQHHPMLRIPRLPGRERPLQKRI